MDREPASINGTRKDPARFPVRAPSVLLLQNGMDADPETFEHLCSGDYDVRVCAEPDLAMRAIMRLLPDIVVLDVGGADLSIAALRRLRLDNPPVAVVVLLPPSSLLDRVSCLDSGADACLTKPVMREELHARLRVHLRRAKKDKQSFQFGTIRIDVVSHTAYAKGKQLDLCAQELQLLELLVRCRGRIVRKSHLIEALHGDSTVNAIERWVSRLRRKFSEVNSAVIIHCARGMGYCLIESGPSPR